MYVIRTKAYSSQNPQMRWALPDRVFFACGACRILAWAFLERHGRAEMKALLLRPRPGCTGNHICVATDDGVCDYHGYSRRERFLTHTFKRARRHWPGWDADIIELP